MSSTSPARTEGMYSSLPIRFPQLGQTFTHRFVLQFQTRHRTCNKLFCGLGSRVSQGFAKKRRIHNGFHIWCFFANSAVILAFRAVICHQNSKIEFSMYSFVRGSSASSVAASDAARSFSFFFFFSSNPRSNCPPQIFSHRAE